MIGPYDLTARSRQHATQSVDLRAFSIALLAVGLIVALAAVVSYNRLPMSWLAVAGDTSNTHVVSVFDGYIPRSKQAAIRAGTSRYDATGDIHKAIRAVDGTGKTLLFPQGTYYVREVAFSGRNYTVDTADVTFQQMPGLTGDGETHAIITFPMEAADIRVGDLRVRGNIATDVDEYSHGIAVVSAKRITIGDIYGEDVRGDVLYTYGRTTSEPEHLRQLTVGLVRGRNIFRCIVALTGGEVAIAGIVQDGPVGYRVLDIEPNAGGAYQPVRATVGFVRGSTVQITSDDAAVTNESVTIERLELDGDSLADSTPRYPKYPGRGAIALAIGRTDRVDIGTLTLRNYDGYPVQLADRWRSITIDTLDFANANTVERTYKAIVLQHGLAGDGVLSIGRVRGALAGPDRFLLRSDRGHLNVDIGTSEISGGQFGAYLSGSVGSIGLDDAGSRACLDCRNMRFGRAAGREAPR